jgi:WD40 repeat protein
MSTRTEVARAPIGGNAEGAECAFSPDGRFVAADDFGGILRLYGMPSLQPMDELKGHIARFLPDGRSFIYVSEKRLLRRGLPGTGTTAETLVGKEAGRINAMALSPDGRTLAATSGGDRGVSIHLWDVESSRLIGSLVGHSGRVHQLAFSPDGQTLASAGWDGKIGLWEAAKRRLIALLPGHIDEAYGVTFSPDGRTVASCGTDAVRLWNVTTFRQVALLETGGTLESVAFSSDGQWLAGAADDGTIRLWRAPSWEDIEVAAEPGVGGQ